MQGRPFSIGRRAAALLFLLLNLSPFPFTTAKTVTRIIDDTYGDQATGFMPIYYPQGDTIWQRNCSAKEGCLIVPDPLLAQNGTWTAATYRPGMDDMGLRLHFKGTAIVVYFIIANDVRSNAPVTTNTECRFTMDGVFQSSYMHQSTAELGLKYDAVVYNETGLEDRLHILEISTGKLDHPTYLAFDHANYTAQVPGEGEEKDGDPPVGAIVGLVVGGVAFLCALVVAGFLLIRRHRHSKEGGIGKITPLFVPRDLESTGPDNSISYPDDRPHSAIMTAPNVHLLNNYRPSSEKRRNGSTVSLPQTNFSHNHVLRTEEVNRLLQQVNRMIGQLQALQRQETHSITGPVSAASSNQMAELHEEIRRLQLQLAPLQQNHPPEEPPGYAL